MVHNSVNVLYCNFMKYHIKIILSDDNNIFCPKLSNPLVKKSIICLTFTGFVSCPPQLFQAASDLCKIHAKFCIPIPDPAAVHFSKH